MNKFTETLFALQIQLGNRFRNTERGQGTLEYIGMIIVAAIIVLAVLNTNMGGTMAGKFTGKINEVLNFGG